jgi:hypothetical protein
LIVHSSCLVCTSISPILTQYLSLIQLPPDTVTSIPHSQFRTLHTLLPHQNKPLIAFIPYNFNLHLLLPDAVGSVPYTIIFALVTFALVKNEAFGTDEGRAAGFLGNCKAGYKSQQRAGGEQSQYPQRTPTALAFGLRRLDVGWGDTSCSDQRFWQFWPISRYLHLLTSL